MTKKIVTWKSIRAIEQSYSEFHLRPPYLCAIHSHFEGFVSHGLKAISFAYQSPLQCFPADSLAAPSSKPPLQNKLCIDSIVQCCSFNMYATIYEDLCCSRILKKKKRGMYVPGTAIDVCIVLTLMYYKFSIKIWGKPSNTRFSF